MPVYLVGAGPGDPDLITVKGLGCIQRADVIIHDYLAPAALLRHAPAGCEMIYVGKKGGQQHIGQEEVNRILVAKAREGGRVVRLKGGDPFVFGRGGEEALVLRQEGIEFEVVPGLTAGLASPAYAGVPVTHRGLSSAVALVTAHEDPAKPESAVDWDALARLGTVVFYMGARTLPQVARKLIDAGKRGDTPAAAIRWGTTSRQETVVGTLADIADRARGLEPPVVTIVGDTVSLRDQLGWFERAPLWGRTVLVTRTREQASALSEALAGLGARVLEMPTICITEPSDWAPADRAIEGLAGLDWIVFTSPNGVARFLDRLEAGPGDVRLLAGAKLAAIGPATAERLREYHLRADVVPDTHTSEGLLAAFGSEAMAGDCVLLARAEDVPDLLPKGLEAMGAGVTEVAVYRTVLPDAFDPDALDALRAGEVDVVTFTSSSTAVNFARALEQAGISLAGPRPAFASIGPVTTQAARQAGFDVSIESQGITIDSLVQATMAHFQ